MNWSDYEAIWKRQELAVGANADLANLRETFETKRRKMAAMLLVRDWIEIAACAVVVISYISFWRNVGSSGWPMAVSILLVLGVGIVFFGERRRTRRQRLGPDAPVQAKIQADLAELHHQRRLLTRVWVWYIAPCVAAMLIQVGVVFNQASAGSRVRTPLSLTGVLVVVALLCWLVWLINRRAVKRWIEPQLEELEKLYRDLLSLK